MSYLTIDIYKGLYSSHQRCKHRLSTLGITFLEEEGQTAISKTDYLSLLYDRHHSARNEETQKEVERRLNEFGVSIPEVKSKPLTKRPSRQSAKIEKRIKKKVWHKALLKYLLDFIETLSAFFSARPMIFATLMMALCIQVHHLANLVNSISIGDGLLIGYIFGAVAEITALMLTVHKAQRWFLILFAFIQFWINILYYCQFPELVTKITLSALIAFVIFSYSELYSSSTIQEK